MEIIILVDVQFSLRVRLSVHQSCGRWWNVVTLEDIPIRQVLSNCTA